MVPALDLCGEAAERAASRVRRHVESWGLRLPDITPIVLDFGLGDFEKSGEVEFWIANEAEGVYCGKFLFVWPGQTCPKHYHEVKLETFFIVRGRIEMEYDGVVQTLILEVSRPSVVADNFFEDTRIPIGGNRADAKRR